MQQSLKIVFWGMLISLLGSLPPGTVTVAATYITAKQGTEAGFIYALGSMIAEVMVVRFVLSVMNWIAGKHKLFFILEIITAILLVLMTIACFYLAVQMNDITEPSAQKSVNPFSAGFILSFINPVHIPFWLGWSIVLINKELLLPKARQYNWYVTGIGIGTMLGFAVFIYGGEFLLTAFRENQHIILRIIGVVLLTVSYIHIRKMMLAPVSVRYSNSFKQRNNKP